MKYMQSMVLGSVMLCSSVAWAGFPFDVGKLGQMRGVLEMCSKTSPQAATNYLLQIKALIGDASKDVVDKASRTEEYQQAYQSIRSEFGALTKDGVDHACASYFESAN